MGGFLDESVDVSEDLWEAMKRQATGTVPPQVAAHQHPDLATHHLGLQMAGFKKTTWQVRKEAERYTPTISDSSIKPP